MQLTEKEKKLVGIISAFAVVCVGGPWAANTYAYEYQQAASAQVSNLKNEISTYEQNIAGIDEQRELLRTNRQSYLRWVEEGVVGRQDPIKWVELMQEIQKSRGLFASTMSWGANDLKVGSTSSPLTDGSSVSIVFTDLNITMPMLHDLDVLMFLSDMARLSSSFFFPLQCTFNRMTDDFELTRRENMLADCNIAWVSVDDPEQVAGKEEQA